MPILIIAAAVFIFMVLRAEGYELKSVIAATILIPGIIIFVICVANKLFDSYIIWNTKRLRKLNKRIRKKKVVKKKKVKKNNKIIK